MFQRSLEVTLQATSRKVLASFYKTVRSPHTALCVRRSPVPGHLPLRGPASYHSLRGVGTLPRWAQGQCCLFTLCGQQSNDPANCPPLNLSTLDRVVLHGKRQVCLGIPTLRHQFDGGLDKGDVVHVQWDTTRPRGKMKSCHLRQHGWTLRALCGGR